MHMYVYIYICTHTFAHVCVYCVTLALVLSGHEKCTASDGAAYVAYAYAAMHHGKTFPLGPVGESTWAAALSKPCLKHV